MGPMPVGSASTTAPNTFSGSQTINGSLIVAGAGNGIQFADGTIQTTAAAGSSSGSVTVSTSATPPAGYSLLAQTQVGGNPGSPGTGTSGWSTGPALTDAGTNVSACTPDGINDWVAGGANITSGYLQDIQWSTSPPTVLTPVLVPTGAEGPGAACIGNNVYVIGGFSLALGPGSTPAFNTNQIYNSAAKTWTTGAAMSTGRYAFGVVTVNGLIYALGGITGITITDDGDFTETTTATVEIYNPSSNTWSTGIPLPQPMDSFAATVSNGTIYVIGGESNGNLLTTAYSFTPGTSTSWSTLSSFTAGGLGLGAAALNGVIYVAGGGNVAPLYAYGYTPATNSWAVYDPMPTPVSGNAVLAVGGTIVSYEGIGCTSISGCSGTDLIQEFVPTPYVPPIPPVPPSTVYYYVKN